MSSETERPEDEGTEQAPPAEDAQGDAVEEPAREAPAEEPATGQPAPEEPAAEESPAEEPAAEEPAAEEPAAEEPAAEEPAAEEPAAEEPAAEASPAEEPAADEPVAAQTPAAPEAGTPEKPVVPGAHLEVDIVPEGADPLGRDAAGEPEYEEIAETEESAREDEEEVAPEPIASAAIDLAAGARYTATGKRKTAVARVILRPGTGAYTVNGRTLDEYFPRATLQKTIRQPLETVGYESRMDVVVNLHGGGVSAQAGALRHGISRALIEADPNLRGELKRRGFLTRDSRAKERKKAGLKKARKRPQFSKR
jgi:small subunit ribosomal protein S9